MAQSRKKAIMEQVQRQRRRNRAVTLGVIVIIAVVIVAVVIALPRTGNAVPLPGYLDRCLTSVTYHYHPGLTIVINGSTYAVPPDVGRSGSCNRPLHTHPNTNNQAVFDGTIHVESDEARSYTLGDFFLIWGNSANNANLAILTGTQIFTNHVDSSHSLSVTVNGGASPNPGAPQNIVIPQNAGDSTNNCDTNSAVPPGGCKPFDIVITYA